jgi:hypothetical protein
MLAQVLEDPHAGDYVRWLNWALWLVLALCTASVIAGAAIAALSTNADAGHRGRTMILAGLAGALAAGLLTQLVHWSYDLIVG